MAAPFRGRVWAGVFSNDPPVLHGRSHLGRRHELPRVLAAAGVPRAVCLVQVTYSLEAPAALAAAVLRWRRFARRHPGIRAILLANTAREAALLARFGVPARHVNQNIFVDETIFRPLPDIAPRFDAVYNASSRRWKRHELAALVASCLLITYDDDKSRPARARRGLARILRLNPHHRLANPVGDDGTVLGLPPPRLNETLATARVGLALSRSEGAMYASIEYLLAGLPVVSTASRGGRDQFFHPDTALVVPDDPRAVRDGVAAMIARNLPRDHVRATTLALVRRERERFETFLSGLTGKPRAPGETGFAAPVINKAMRPLTEAELADLLRRLGGRPPAGPRAA